MPAWWDKLVFSEGPETDWFVRSVFREICSRGRPVYSCVTNSSVDLASLDAFLITAGLRLALERVEGVGARSEILERIYVREDSIVRTHCDPSGDVYLALESFDRSLRESLATFLRENGAPQ